MEEENKTIDEAVSEGAETVPAEDVTTEAPVVASVTETPQAPAAEPTPTQDAQGQEKDGKKPMSKGRRIANAIILGIQIAFVVIAITICLVVLLNPKAQDDISPLGVKLLTVNSNSMNGTEKDSFSVNDLVIARNAKNGGEGLQVGQIVSFKMLEENSGEFIINTHRIVEVHTENGFTQYFTKGDANPTNDKGWLRAEDILAVYSFHISGLGAVIKWIRDGYHFIYVVIIPLGLLLIYNVYLVIQIVMESKMKKAKAAAAADALSNLSQEDIERLLAQRGINPATIQPQDPRGDSGDNDGEH